MTIIDQIETIVAFPSLIDGVSDAKSRIKDAHALLIAAQRSIRPDAELPMAVEKNAISLSAPRVLGRRGCGYRSASRTKSLAASSSDQRMIDF